MQKITVLIITQPLKLYSKQMFFRVNKEGKF